MRESDRQYFGRRAEEERLAAAGAGHPAAARVHLEMALRYDDLAQAIAGSEHQFMPLRVA